MAQDTFVNITVGKGSASQPDRTNHSHQAGAGTAAASDFTVSFDAAVVTKLAIFDSAVAAARTIAIARGLK